MQPRVVIKMALLALVFAVSFVLMMKIHKQQAFKKETISSASNVGNGKEEREET